MSDSFALFLMFYALIAAFIGWAMYDSMQNEPLRMWLVCVVFGILWMPLFALAVLAFAVGPIFDSLIDHYDRKNKP